MSDEAAAAIVDENAQARLDGLRSALAVLALIAVVGLFFTGRIPAEQPGSEKKAVVTATGLIGRVSAGRRGSAAAAARRSRSRPR